MGRSVGETETKQRKRRNLRHDAAINMYNSEILTFPSTPAVTIDPTGVKARNGSSRTPAFGGKRPFTSWNRKGSWTSASVSNALVKNTILECIGRPFPFLLACQRNVHRESSASSTSYKPPRKYRFTDSLP